MIFDPVGLDDDLTDGTPRSPGPGARTITDSVPDGQVIIYPHGYSVRVTLAMPIEDAIDVLARCGWSESPDPRAWIIYGSKNGIRRCVMRGSAWLTGRAPSNRSLPMARKNAAWRTRIYSLAIDLNDDQVHVDIQGVRYRDVERFMEDVLLLGCHEYTVDYYRSAERYVVLRPHDAHRLADALGEQPESGRGRLARKRYLVKEHAVPVTVRARTKTTAGLSIYRIARGATAHFKCEVRLKGKKRNRRTFRDDDIEKLDRILLELVEEHGLRPTCKPARWEPRDTKAAVERGLYDPIVRMLGQKAWRGSQPSLSFRRLVEECHPPRGLRLLQNPGATDTYPAQPRIRTDSPISRPTSTTTSNPPSPLSLVPQVTDTGTLGTTGTRWTRGTTPTPPTKDTESSWRSLWGGGFDIRCWTSSEDGAEAPQAPPGRRSAYMRPGGPWVAIGDEVGALPGSLVEVILDGCQDPGPLLRALGRHSGMRMGISALCSNRGGEPETWRTVMEMMLDHPVVEDIDLWVVVVDTSTAEAVVPSLWRNVAEKIDWGPEWGIFPLQARTMAAWLWPILAEWRGICETSGMSIVLVTTDLRPHHARGPVLRSHFFRDARFRSWIGDAGRYFCHQRYRVEPDLSGLAQRVVAVKDEAEGLVGRIVYDRPAWASWETGANTPRKTGGCSPVVSGEQAVVAAGR